jgi:hypothetical protein
MKFGNFTVAIILFIQAWTCFANHPLPADASRCCVEVGGEGYVCSDDPIGTRKLVDTPKVSKGKVEQISRGVTQRIDGTDAEQNAIREVLAQMDTYFFEEVLSKPEYEGIRTKWYVFSRGASLACSHCQIYFSERNSAHPPCLCRL